MSEMFFLLIILILVGILIFLLRQNQKSSEIWKQEITNLRLEFGQQIQGTIQNINSQIQNTAFQLNQRLDNSISSLSNHVNQAITQMVGVVTSNLQTITESTGQVNQRLDNAARIMSDLMKQIGEIKEGANQIKIVGQNIARLEDLFTSPKYRGGIGEIMLEKMIQDTLPKEYYEIQFEFKDRKRVDAIIKINNKILPIDSKFPLDNYRKMTETKDESEKEKMKKEFFKDIKKRADEIASNYIRPDENTFDFAIICMSHPKAYIMRSSQTKKTKP
ncbi:MAG: DNA recombination protein RmuC [Candidatus Kryptonium sp.]